MISLQREEIVLIQVLPSGKKSLNTQQKVEEGGKKKEQF